MQEYFTTEIAKNGLTKIRNYWRNKMTEKLGVLLLELPNSWYKYVLLMKSAFPVDKLTIWETDDKEEIVKYAYQCAEEEAKEYPQFRWVSLEEL